MNTSTFDLYVIHFICIKLMLVREVMSEYTP